MYFYSEQSYTIVQLLLAQSALSLFVAAVVVAIFHSAVCSSLWFGVIQDVSVGLDEVLLLFEIHFQHSLDHYEGDATLDKSKTLLGIMVLP